MRSKLSIGRRLMIWNIAGMSLILVVFCVLMSALMRGHLYERIDLDLEEEAKELIEEIRELPSVEELRNRFDRKYAEHGGYSFQIEDADGQVICGTPWLRSHRMPPTKVVNGEAETSLRDLNLEGLGAHRILTKSFEAPSGVITIRVVVPYSMTQREFAEFLILLASAAIASLVLSAVGGEFLARRALRPIGLLASAAERISTENLSMKIEVDNPDDELGRLASTLNHAFERLQISVDQMQRFTADAAHELRTPLSVIQTRVEVALRQLCDDDSVHCQNYSVLLEQIRRLARLVDQLLLLSKHDAGLSQFMFDEVCVRSLLLDVVESLRPMAETREIEIVVGELPDVFVLGDDVSLSQLFHNLIENGIKYSATGGRVDVVMSRDTNFVRISVCDQGCGIATEHLPRIFERFYRIDWSRNNLTGGTGLGLAICQSISVSHSGKIKVQSVLGRGTVFIVELPVIKIGSREESFCETELATGSDGSKAVESAGIHSH